MLSVVHSEGASCCGRDREGAPAEGGAVREHRVEGVVRSGIVGVLHFQRYGSLGEIYK